MLLVKTIIKPSNIAGIGLFADEFIKKGTLVWRFDPRIDIYLSKEEVDTLSEAAQKQFYNYSYLDKIEKKYLLCGDDGRFFNHSVDPNCDDEKPNLTFAIKDIKVGEELTVNYESFYENFSEVNSLLSS